MINFNSSRFIALLLILWGGSLLLNNLGIIDFSLSEIFRTYWPVALILLGLKFAQDNLNTRNKARHQKHSLSTIVFLLVVGGTLLANNLDLLHLRASSFWGIFWPVLLIYIGLQAFSHRDHFFVLEKHPDFGPEEDDKPERTVSAFVGDFNLGDKPFELKDLNYDLKIGDIQLDLTQALIPDKETTLNITGLIGDIEIFIPRDLPVKVEAIASIGDCDVLGNHSSGMNKPVWYQSPGYEEATKRVRIFVQLKVGQISVRSV